MLGFVNWIMEKKHHHYWAPLFLSWWRKGVLQAPEVRVTWKKLVSRSSRTGCATVRLTWTAKSETTRCVQETSTEESTAAKYNKTSHFFRFCVAVTDGGKQTMPDVDQLYLDKDRYKAKLKQNVWKRIKATEKEDNSDFFLRVLRKKSEFFCFSGLNPLLWIPDWHIKHINISNQTEQGGAVVRVVRLTAWGLSEWRLYVLYESFDRWTV